MHCFCGQPGVGRAVEGAKTVPCALHQHLADYLYVAWEGVYASHGWLLFCEDTGSNPKATKAWQLLDPSVQCAYLRRVDGQLRGQVDGTALPAAAIPRRRRHRLELATGTARISTGRP